MVLRSFFVAISILRLQTDKSPKASRTLCPDVQVEWMTVIGIFQLANNWRVSIFTDLPLDIYVTDLSWSRYYTRLRVSAQQTVSSGCKRSRAVGPEVESSRAGNDRS